jgi:hypothetical protein
MHRQGGRAEAWRQGALQEEELDPGGDAGAERQADGAEGLPTDLNMPNSDTGRTSRTWA